MNYKPFYKKPSFYLGAAALLLAVLAIALYAGNCASEFNGGKPSQAVTAWESIAIVLLAAAVACEVAEYFVINSGLLNEICKYTRFMRYIAFIALLIAFFMQILDEYSLLGTILYPIVSGTVGDPVDPTLSACYFVSLVFALLSVIVSIVSALLQKYAAYKKPVKNGQEGR